MKGLNIFRLTLGVVFFLPVFSCKKFVAIPPTPTQILSYKVFEDDGTAAKAITGIYIQMISNNNLFSSGNTTFYPGLSADELYFYSNDAKQEFLKNEISPNNHDLISIIFWSPAYKYIYAANACIEGLAKSTSLTPSVKRGLTGEAKFIRAYCYFYLVNLFGDVPLITTTDYELNSLMPRILKANVYDQIINDLTDAQSLLEVSYVSSDRVRPNKWAAVALLARAYLYKRDWFNAITQSSMVISSGMYSLQSNLSNVFLKGSSETIFQLQAGTNNINTWEGNVFIPPSNSVTPTYLLTNTILNSFEVGDLRRTNWVQSRTFAGQTLFYPFKYKVQSNSSVTEYYVYLRLAEQYLIRAEAKAQQNDIAGSQADLNTIRSRAGLPNTTAADKTSLLLAVEHERQVELFAEWGHRWFDLIRTNRANIVLGALKPTTWQPTDTLWPIPSIQINLNPALTQNKGY
jgi:starch-binding outer membrane protein, SusD/RagB family